jgi:predicted permease
VTAGQSVYEDVLTAIATVPGVESATLSAMPLLAKSEWTQGVLIDAGGEPDEAYVQSVRWNFFDTLGLPVRAGRALTAGDRIGRLPVAVVNEAMARQIFEDPNPTGRRFTFADGPVKNISIEVVGVVADAKYASLDQEAPPTVYLPYTQLPTGAMTCEIRTTGDPVSLIPAVRSAVQGVSVDLLPYDLTTQDDRIAQTLDSPRMLALVTAIFGGVALFLTCIGLAGTVAFDVSRRTAEIGLRLALGAQRADVLRLILRDTAWIVMTGLAAGTVLTQIATRAVSSEFFGVRSSDPLSMALAALLLGVVATVAAFVPARRALGVDPVQALRRE